MGMLLAIVGMVTIVFSALLMGADSATNSNAALAFFIGIVLVIVGAVLHMRKRRKEQLDAMRGK